LENKQSEKPISPLSEGEGLGVRSEKLSWKHRRFIDQYLLHGDKHAAYRAVYPGISDKAVGAAARRLFNTPHIKQRIEEALHGRQKEMIAVQAQSIKDQLDNYELLRTTLQSIMSGSRTFEKALKTKEGFTRMELPAGPEALLQAMSLSMKLTKMTENITALKCHPLAWAEALGNADAEQPSAPTEAEVG
jgi:hypothetical protein